MVVQEFSQFMSSEGTDSIESVGVPFNPHVHEALEQVPTEDESKNGLVIEEVQKGYSLNGRLLRPAKVKVAKFLKDKNNKE